MYLAYQVNVVSPHIWLSLNGGIGVTIRLGSCSGLPGFKGEVKGHFDDWKKLIYDTDAVGILEFKPLGLPGLAV